MDKFNIRYDCGFQLENNYRVYEKYANIELEKQGILLPEDGSLSPKPLPLRWS